MNSLNKEEINLPIRLAIVLPCFNENESIELAASELSSLITEMTDEGVLKKTLSFSLLTMEVPIKPGPQSFVFTAIVMQLKD